MSSLFAGNIRLRRGKQTSTGCQAVAVENNIFTCIYMYTCIYIYIRRVSLTFHRPNPLINLRLVWDYSRRHLLEVPVNGIEPKTLWLGSKLLNHKGNTSDFILIVLSSKIYFYYDFKLCFMLYSCYILYFKHLDRSSQTEKFLFQMLSFSLNWLFWKSAYLKK